MTEFRQFALRLLPSIVFVLLWANFSFSQAPEKLVKEADKQFGQENFIEATTLYLQLLSLEPRNSLFNYRYGACLLFNSEKKPDALKYLKFAVTDPDVDPEAHYYLARAYHVNYYFDRAIRSYKTYKGLVRDKTALKRDVDRQIEMCINGQKLMSDVSEIIVKEKKSSTYDNFYRLYNLKDIGGTIIITQDFQTKIDKKRNHVPVIHYNEDRDIIFYSSYGETDEEQKDIYYRLRNQDGSWGDAVLLPNSVNTKLDDDYPYLDASGQYLYFSSKGHNSMGGYDIFKIPINLEEMKFGRIENLDFAISSPDDDVFYVVDQANSHAYFASARQSEGGKIHVYRVLVNKFESNMMLVAGGFVSSGESKAMTLQIKDKATGKIIEEVKSNPNTGALNFSLPRAGEYEFIIASNQLSTPQKLDFTAPALEESKLIKINFIEEKSGSVTSIRISQDDYYTFTEDEKSDALAALFLGKSELTPNAELQELLENQTPTNPKNSNSQEVLASLNLSEYDANELPQIAAQDLNIIKENYKLNDDQRKVYLQLASKNIDEAQNVEEAMNKLFDKAENENLTNEEKQELANLDKMRSNYLEKARISKDLADKLQIKLNYLQGDLAKADAVNQKFQEIKEVNQLDQLNNLSESEKSYVRDNFNRAEPETAGELIQLDEASQQLRQIETTNDELVQVKGDLAAKNDALIQLEEDLENARKKDKEAIENQIETTRTEIEQLENREQFLKDRVTKLKSDEDSLNNILALFSESKKINPNEVSNADNARLLEAKLKSEDSKRIQQRTQTVTGGLVASENSDKTETTNSTNNQEKIDEIHNLIQENAENIYNLEEQIQKTDSANLSELFELTEAKERLLKEQIKNLNALKDLSDDPETIDQELAVQQSKLNATEQEIARIEALAPEISSTKATTNKVVSEEISSLREKQNIEEDFGALDKFDEETFKRMEDYAANLETLKNSESWSEEQQNQIDEELARVQNWLEGKTEVADNTNSNGQSNESQTGVIGSSNVIATVSPDNIDAELYAKDIAQNREENIGLMAELADASSSREEKRIIKKIEKNEKEIFDSQYKLLLSEKDDYDIVQEQIQKSLDENTLKDPMIRSEMLILQQRIEEVKEVIEVLENTDRFDKERVLVQAVSMRNDFINQRNRMVAQIREQQEINRLIKQFDVNESLLVDGNKLDFALANVIENIAETEEQILFLEDNLEGYSKEDKPKIEADIERLKAQLVELKELKKLAQSKIQARNAGIVASEKVPSLTNTAVEPRLVDSLSQQDMFSVIQNPEFLPLRNDLVTLRSLDGRLANLNTKESALRQAIQAKIVVISNTADEDIRKTNQNDLDSLIAIYQKNEADIETVRFEMNRLVTNVQNNKLYNENPTLYNSLAASNKLQQFLLDASQMQVAAGQQNAPSAVSSGINFVLEGNSEPKEPNFELNPMIIPGMIYKIQIGAFNRPIDINQFSQFDPVTTDQVGNSIRYSAGIFYTKDQASGSLSPIKALGYADAFVVAYCDGVRYSVAEADELLRQGKCSLNNAAIAQFNQNKTQKNTTYNQGANAAPAQALEAVNGLLFTVQIGVFNTPRSHELLKNLEPLNTQLTEKNQIRYSLGRFTAVSEAVAQRNAVREQGFSDAFVVAYFNGERISIAEANAIIAEQGDLAFFNNQSQGSGATNVPAINPDDVVIDSVAQIEYLTSHNLEYRLVSRKTYSKVPESLIDDLRSQNIWFYFNPKTGQVLSSVLPENFENNFEGFEMVPIYQGFTTTNTTDITYEDLQDFEANFNYYELKMKWSGELPAIVAFALMENFNFSISSWNPEANELTFKPLNYIEKEKIKKRLFGLGLVRFEEAVVTF